MVSCACGCGELVYHRTRNGIAYVSRAHMMRRFRRERRSYTVSRKPRRGGPVPCGCGCGVVLPFSRRRVAYLNPAHKMAAYRQRKLAYAFTPSTATPLVQACGCGCGQVVRRLTRRGVNQSGVRYVDTEHKQAAQRARRGTEATSAPKTPGRKPRPRCKRCQKRPVIARRCLYCKKCRPPHVARRAAVRALAPKELRVKHSWVHDPAPPADFGPRVPPIGAATCRSCALPVRVELDELTRLVEVCTRGHRHLVATTGMRTHTQRADFERELELRRETAMRAVPTKPGRKAPQSARRDYRKESYAA